MERVEVREGLQNLGALKKVSAVDIKGFIRSAYTLDNQLNTDYIHKNEQAYSAFLNKSIYAIILTIVPATDAISPEKLYRDLYKLGLTPIEADLAKLIESMVFPSYVQPELAECYDSPKVELTEDEKCDIDLAVNDVMCVYEELYGNVFDPIRPKGAYSPYIGSSDVKLPNGSIVYNTGTVNVGGKDVRRAPSSKLLNRVSALYNYLFDSANLVEASKVNTKELGKVGSRLYYSTYAGRFASGVTEFGGKRCANRAEFMQKLRDWVFNELANVYREWEDKGEDAQYAALEAAKLNLVTSVVASEYDPIGSKLLVLKICAPNMLTEKPNIVELNKIYKAKNYQGAMVKAVYEKAPVGTGFPVYTIVVSLDALNEKDTPIYAYKVWDEICRENGGTVKGVISTERILFGRRDDGSMQFLNMLSSLDSKHIACVAASRSGKGLTTLCTLAAAAANGQPIFYLDCKPEMSAMLWNYMKTTSYAGRVFSYDALGEDYTQEGKKREPIAGSNVEKYKHYEYMFDLGEGFDIAPSFGGYIYAKALTLLFAIMSFVGDPSRRDALGYDFKQGGLAVIDELQKAFNEHWVFLRKLCADKNIVGEKEGKNLTPKAEYFLKLNKYLEMVESRISSANTAIMGKSPIATLTLFQKFDFITSATKDMPFTGIMNHRTLVGRVDSSGAKGKTSEGWKDIEGNVVTDAGKARQWFYVESGPKAVRLESLEKPIKPLLLFLDEQEVAKYMNDSAFQQLPSSVKAEAIEKNKEGKLDFVGFLKAYGIDLSESLRKGYDVAQRLLTLAGFEGTVDDFVLSAHPDTFLTDTQLTERAKKGLEAELNGGTAVYDNSVGNDFVNTDSVQVDGEVSTADSVTNVDDVDVAYSSEKVTPEETYTHEEETSEETYIHEEETSEDSRTTGFNTAAQTAQNIQQSFDSRLNQPFPQFQYIFMQQSPQVQQQTLLYQRLYGKPCVYSDADGVFLMQDEEGMLHAVSGRYAVPQNVQPGVYQNQERTTQPIVDFNGVTACKIHENGQVDVSDVDGYTHGRPVNEPITQSKWKLPRLTSRMSQKKFEQSIEKRWFTMLQAGAKLAGGTKAVVRVDISENALFVNGKSVLVGDILNDTGLRISDIIDYAELFRHYKNMRELNLDARAMVTFWSTYTKMSTPFIKNKNLQVIKYTDTNNRQITYTRQHAAKDMQVPVDRLTAKFNTWTAFTAQVNQGNTSSFTKPGTRLRTWDYTKKFAKGLASPKSEITRGRRFGNFLLMTACGLGTVVTGGIQMARALPAHKK